MTGHGRGCSFAGVVQGTLPRGEQRVRKLQGPRKLRSNFFGGTAPFSAGNQNRRLALAAREGGSNLSALISEHHEISNSAVRAQD